MSERTYRSSASRDWGLFVLRIGLGACFVAHGWPKLVGGAAGWEKIGQAAAMPAPTVMGLIAGLIEFGGGILLILGLLTRFAALLLLIQMLVAIFRVHLRLGGPMGQFGSGYSHPLEDAVTFLALMILGSGGFGLDELMTRRRLAARASLGQVTPPGARPAPG